MNTLNAAEQRAETVWRGRMTIPDVRLAGERLFTVALVSFVVANSGLVHQVLGSAAPRKRE